MLRVVICVLFACAATLLCAGCRHIKAPYTPKEPAQPKKEVVQDATTKPATRPTSGPVFVIYTVQRGDRSLSIIAQKIYHNASNWQLIIEDNPGLDEKNFKVGQVIRLRVKKKMYNYRV